MTADRTTAGPNRTAAPRAPAKIAPLPHWTNPPVPEPRAVEPAAADEQPEGRDPVRYGDWELKGLAIDF